MAFSGMGRVGVGLPIGSHGITAGGACAAATGATQGRPPSRFPGKRPRPRQPLSRLPRLSALTGEKVGAVVESVLIAYLPPSRLAVGGLRIGAW
jgi:hypothetical protein